MGLIKGIFDFALFKEFVTPAFLKILYLLAFIILNLCGIIAIAFALVTSVLSALTFANTGTNGDLMPLLVSIVIALIISIVMLVALLVYNLILRMYFEIILLMFNIHGYLKSIDDKTVKAKK